MDWDASNEAAAFSAERGNSCCLLFGRPMAKGAAQVHQRRSRWGQGQDAIEHPDTSGQQGGASLVTILNEKTASESWGEIGPYVSFQSLALSSHSVPDLSCSLPCP